MLNSILTYFFSSVSSSAIVFFVSVYAARSLTVEEYGVVGLFLAAIYLVKPIGVFCSAELVAVMKSRVSKEEFKKFSDSYITLSIVVFIFLQIISIALAIIVDNYYVFILSIPVLVFVMNLNDFHNRELIQKSNSFRHGWYLLLTRIIFALLFVLLEDFGLGLESYVLSLLIADCFILLVRAKVEFRTLTTFSFSLEKEGILKIIRYGSV